MQNKTITNMQNKTLTFDSEYEYIGLYLIEGEFYMGSDCNGTDRYENRYYFANCTSVVDEYRTDEDGTKYRIGLMFAGEIFVVSESGRIVCKTQQAHFHPASFRGARVLARTEYNIVNAKYEAMRDEEKQFIERIKELVHNSDDYKINLADFGV